MLLKQYNFIATKLHSLMTKDGEVSIFFALIQVFIDPWIDRKTGDHIVFFLPVYFLVYLSLKP